MLAAITIIKKTVKEALKASEKLFRGEITVSKKDCWFIGIILVLTGITLGLICAPLTHGISVRIFSNNGNNNGNSSGNNNGNSNSNGNQGNGAQACEDAEQNEEAYVGGREEKLKKRKKIKN